MAEQISKLEHKVGQFDGEWCDLMDELIKKIRAQAEEVEQLRRDKGNLMEANSSQGRRIANSELEISALKEEIERLKATPIYEELATTRSKLEGALHAIEDLKARGVSKDALQTLWERNSLSAVVAYFRDKGLLIEDAPSPTKHRDFMALPVEERRKQMEAQCTPEMVKHYEHVNAEADPLKLDPKHTSYAADWTVAVENLQIVYNGLVDEVRQIQRTINSPSVLETRLSTLEQRLSQPAEQVAWPKLPQLKPTEDWTWLFVFEEFARIRAKLRVKEVE